MTAVDTNILVHAHRKDSKAHDLARTCLQVLAESPLAWAIPWPCVHEFLAVVTNRRIFSNPSSIAEAAAQIEGWLKSPSLTLIGETSAHWLYLERVLTAGNIVGPMTHDARIAAICSQHGVVTLFSADRDFSRFPELHTVNPLVS